MLRFPRRVGERFLALVRADSAGVRAGFVALLISSGGDLVTGITLGSISNTLQMLPGLIVLVPEEDTAGPAWEGGIAKEWSAELNDSREDIYTPEDGQPVNAAA